MTNNSSNATNGGADIETAGTKTNPTETTFPKASGTTIGFVQELGSWLKHHQGLLQAILTWLILCVPGNIVTLVLYFKLHSESDMKADEAVENPDQLLNEEISYIENSLEHLEENTATNTNQTLENYVKPKYQCYESVTVGTLWVFRIVFSQSIGILLVGIFGLFGNFMTILVLRRIDTNVMFNRLLLTLAVFDSLYLIFSIGEHGIIDLLRSHTLYCINCIVSNFSSNLCTAPAIKEPMWYRITYPYILWPMNKMFFAATVFMIVAISAERHRAICSPLTHRPTFWPYVLLVLCISVTFNIPKFFEFRLETVQKGNETDYQYQTTKLNEQKNYIAFSSWWDDLIVLGIIPLVALLVFNSKIYMKVRGSSKMEYRFVGRRSLRSNRSRDQQHPSQHFSSSSGAKSINGADFGNEIGIQKMNESFDSSTNRGSNAANTESIEMKVVTHALDKAYGIKRSSSGSSVTEMDRKSGQTTNGSDSKCQYFQKRKEKSAKILITIVVTFLICHTFRFVFKIYEVISPDLSLPEHHQYCSKQKRWPVPIALHIMVSLNHFLQVVNSSINFIIYCCVAKRFRNELKSVLSSACQRLFGRRETQDKETQVTDGIDVL